jgi:hypothetical protein
MIAIGKGDVAKLKGDAAAAAALLFVLPPR